MKNKSMIKLTGSLALLLCLAVFPKLSFADTICSDQPVPAGDVITAIGTSSSCGYLQYTVQAVPATTANPTGLWMCSISPIPSGHIVTDIHDSSTTCNGGSQFYIDYPKAGMDMCSTGPVPSGLVATQVYDFGVGANCGTSYKEYYLRTPSTGTMMCNVGPIPSGFVVTNIQSNTISCGANILGYTLAVPSGTMTMCDLTTVPPSGFTVIGGPYNPTSACGSTQSEYDISGPTSGSGGGSGGGGSTSTTTTTTTSNYAWLVPVVSVLLN